MKIGLVCPYNIFKGGGVQECVKELQEELTKRGHDVLILTPRPIGVKDNGHSNIVFIGSSVDVKSPFQSTTGQGAVSVDQKELALKLDNHKFDVLHFHEPEIPFLSKQIMSKSNAAHVGTFHAKLPETLISKSVEKFLAPYARSILKLLDETTAVSDAASIYIKTISKENPTIVPNGVDIDKFKPKTTKKGMKKSKNVLYVGRLEGRKGVKYLLLAFAQLQNVVKNVNLKIVGAGPDLKKLQTLVRTKKIKNVEFLGHVSEAEKVRLLQNADLFCSPAIFGESFGIVLLEAMAAGTVVVAGDNPGYTSVMKGRGALSIVDPTDTSEFSRRLNLLLLDDDLRKSWLEWASDYIQQFSYEIVTEQYLQVYKDALKKHRAVK